MGRHFAVASVLEQPAALAQLIATVYAHESDTIERLRIDESVQEVVLTAGAHWLMVTPLQVTPQAIALSIFDARRTNIVMARAELKDFVATFDAWSARATH